MKLQSHMITSLPFLIKHKGNSVLKITSLTNMKGKNISNIFHIKLRSWKIIPDYYVLFNNTKWPLISSILEMAISTHGLIERYLYVFKCPDEILCVVENPGKMVGKELPLSHRWQLPSKALSDITIT